MGKVVHLVPLRASKETIESLTALLAEARAGGVVGLAYVAMQSDGTYTADTLGACKSSRTITLGALLTLQHQILET